MMIADKVRRPNNGTNDMSFMKTNLVRVWLGLCCFWVVLLAGCSQQLPSGPGLSSYRAPAFPKGAHPLSISPANLDVYPYEPGPAYFSSLLNGSWLSRLFGLIHWICSTPGYSQAPIPYVEMGAAFTWNGERAPVIP